MRPQPGERGASPNAKGPATRHRGRCPLDPPPCPVRPRERGSSSPRHRLPRPRRAKGPPPPRPPPPPATGHRGCELLLSVMPPLPPHRIRSQATSCRGRRGTSFGAAVHCSLPITVLCTLFSPSTEETAEGRGPRAEGPRAEAAWRAAAKASRCLTFGCLN